MCVSVYVSRANDEGQPWQLFARHKAHYGKIEGTIHYNIRPATLSLHSACQCMIHQLMLNITTDIKILSLTDLMFGVKLDSSAPRLLSISSDRTIVSF